MRGVGQSCSLAEANRIVPGHESLHPFTGADDDRLLIGRYSLPKVSRMSRHTLGAWAGWMRDAGRATVSCN
jgi:hypothetical protein